MNTNPSAIKVLCYGDSNTWGQKPDRSSRYETDVRWTGLLQKSLGDDYYIVEEGLGGRTTDLDYSEKSGRNGKTYLTPCLESHNPLDFVVLMLGTNDLKTQYERSAQDIARAIQGLVADIRKHGKDKNGNPPRIILVSPILIDDKAKRFAEFYTSYYDERSAQEFRNLAGAISEMAEKNNCIFMDAALLAKPGEDGIHMSEESHTSFAKALELLVRKLTIN